MLPSPARVCFVCSGNICRSPTAEVVLARIARDDGGAHLVVDSAGTGDWHVGDDMDPRSRRTMTHAGYAVPAHIAKQFTAADFATRDVVVALDTGHYNALWWLAPEPGDAAGSAANRAKLVLLRAFDPQLRDDESPDVGDPYYGGADGFADVLDRVERSCAALFTAIRVAQVTGRPLAGGGPSTARTAAGQQADSPPW